MTPTLTQVDNLVDFLKTDSLLNLRADLKLKDLVTRIGD